MPSVYGFKPAFQQSLRPLVRALVAAGVKPNQLTLAALVGSLVVGAAVGAFGHEPRWLLLLPGWLFARMALNAMDGMAAREHHMATRLGGALNEVGDFVSDLALYLPLAIAIPGAMWSAMAFALGAAFTEFCGLLGPTLGGSRRYDGPMGKSDRALVIGVLAIVAAVWPASLRYATTILWIASALTVFTCWNRVAAVLREPTKAAA